MDLKEWIAKAQALRAGWYENEAAFYLFLVDGEAGEVEWKGAYNAFEELLVEVGTDARRYASFRNALEVIDREHVALIGVDGTIVAAQVQDREKRAQVVISLEGARERRGIPLSRQEAQRHVQSIAPVERPTRDLTRALSRDKLTEENKSLRKELERLSKENSDLRMELEKIKGRKKTG